MKKLISILLAVSALLLCSCSGQAGQPETTTAETTQAFTEEPAQTTEQTTQSTVIPDKLIALTFDDGPNVKNSMADVLDILESYDVKATFFLIGELITYETKDIIQRAYDAGHELGNHSYSHDNMSEMGTDDVMYEFSKVQDLVKAITGEEPTLFRAPFLAISDTMRETITAPFINGYAPGDSAEGVTADQIASRVLENAVDGAVILMHVSKGYDWTEEALHTIIPELRSQGYEFVTVSDLFSRKGITPENGITYSVIGES